MAVAATAGDAGHRITGLGTAEALAGPRQPLLADPGHRRELKAAAEGVLQGPPGVVEGQQTMQPLAVLLGRGVDAQQGREGLASAMAGSATGPRGAKARDRRARRCGDGPQGRFNQIGHQVGERTPLFIALQRQTPVGVVGQGDRDPAGITKTGRGHSHQRHPNKDHQTRTWRTSALNPAISPASTRPEPNQNQASTRPEPKQHPSSATRRRAPWLLSQAITGPHQHQTSQRVSALSSAQSALAIPIQFIFPEMNRKTETSSR